MKYQQQCRSLCLVPTTMSMVRELTLTLSCHVAANIVLHNVNLAHMHNVIGCYYAGIILKCFLVAIIPVLC